MNTSSTINSVNLRMMASIKEAQIALARYVSFCQTELIGEESAFIRATIQDEINRTIAIYTRAGIALTEAGWEMDKRNKDKAESMTTKQREATRIYG